jgi:hypothetical protein
MLKQREDAQGETGIDVVNKNNRAGLILGNSPDIPTCAGRGYGEEKTEGEVSRFRPGGDKGKDSGDREKDYTDLFPEKGPQKRCRAGAF